MRSSDLMLKGPAESQSVHGQWNWKAELKGVCGFSCLVSWSNMYICLCSCRWHQIWRHAAGLHHYIRLWDTKLTKPFSGQICMIKFTFETWSYRFTSFNSIPLTCKSQTVCGCLALCKIEDRLWFCTALYCSEIQLSTSATDWTALNSTRKTILKQTIVLDSTLHAVWLTQLKFWSFWPTLVHCVCQKGFQIFMSLMACVCLMVKELTL